MVDVVPKTNKSSKFYHLEVIKVKHYTDQLFWFQVRRPEGFRFRSGEFVMIGLMGDNQKPLLRAYSVASPQWDEVLEFYSVKVPDGPLTSKLQHIQSGDHVLMGRKPTGTLVYDALRPGKRLYMFSTGTGIAPFTSIIRDIETYDKFEQVILTHTCRHVADLAYGQEVFQSIKTHEVLSEIVGERLHLYNSVTREDFPVQERITTLIETKRLFRDLKVSPLNVEEDRVMICGSMAMLKDTKDLCLKANMQEGSLSMPGHFVIERAFVG